MTEEKRRKLEYAHRFALDHIRDESRGYWTKVAALLTVNSLLVAGFALLYVYGKESDITKVNLLSAIAASGIAIQAMWFWFTIQSYAHFIALYELIRKYEEQIAEIDKDDFKTKASKPWLHFAEIRDRYMIIPHNLAAAISLLLFTSIFIAVWLNALKLLEYNSLIHLYVPLAFIILSAIICAYIALFRIRILKYLIPFNKSCQNKPGNDE